MDARAAYNIGSAFRDAQRQHGDSYTPNDANQERGLDTVTVNDDVEEDRQSDGEDIVKEVAMTRSKGLAEALVETSYYWEGDLI